VRPLVGKGVEQRLAIGLGRLAGDAKLHLETRGRGKGIEANLRGPAEVIASGRAVGCAASIGASRRIEIEDVVLGLFEVEADELAGCPGIEGNAQDGAADWVGLRRVGCASSGGRGIVNAGGIEMQFRQGGRRRSDRRDRKRIPAETKARLETSCEPPEDLHLSDFRLRHLQLYLTAAGIRPFFPGTGIIRGSMVPCARRWNPSLCLA
jgi:hypothetical protein